MRRETGAFPSWTGRRGGGGPPSPRKDWTFILQVQRDHLDHRPFTHHGDGEQGRGADGDGGCSRGTFFGGRMLADHRRTRVPGPRDRTGGCAVRGSNEQCCGRTRTPTMQLAEGVVALPAMCGCHRQPSARCAAPATAAHRRESSPHHCIEARAHRQRQPAQQPSICRHLSAQKTPRRRGQVFEKHALAALPGEARQPDPPRQVGVVGEPARWQSPAR